MTTFDPAGNDAATVSGNATIFWPGDHAPSHWPVLSMVKNALDESLTEIAALLDTGELLAAPAEPSAEM